MALTVAKPKAQPKITVTTAKGGLQGSTANPQKTAPATTLQRTTSPQKTAPATVVQNTYNPQAAAQATAAAEHAAATAQAAAIAQAAIIKEQTRVRVQGVLDGKVASNLSTLKVAAAPAAARVKLRTGRVATPRIVVPKSKDTRSEYQKAYDDAFDRANEDSKSKQSAGKKNFAQSLWDKVTFGQDRRNVSARSYADKKGNDIAKQQSSAYEKTLKKFLAEQAGKKSNIEKTKFTSKAAFDRAVSDYDKWQQDQINQLERSRGNITGAYEGYSKFSKSPVTSTAAAKAISAAHSATKPAHSLLGNVWKYTLGSGSQNVPSVVTAPSRAVNFIGNLNTKNRTIYQEGGGSMNRAGSKQNAWQATFNQRNFNVRPWVDVPYSKAAAEKKFGEKATSYVNAMKQIKSKNKDAVDRDKVLQSMWDADNDNNKRQNTLLNLVADPLNFAGGVTASGNKFVSNAAKTSKVGNWVGKTAAAAGSTKLGQATKKAASWLNQEHKTLEQRRSDYVQQELDDIYQKKPEVRKYIEEWMKNKHSIKAQSKAESALAVTNDFAGFSKQETAIYQKFVRNGHKWDGIADDLPADRRAQIEATSDKWRKHLDDLVTKENKKGVATPYRQNYIPQYTKNYNLFTILKNKKKGAAGDWWFTQQQKHQQVQKKKQLIKSLAARDYYSKLSRQDLPNLRESVAGRADIAENIDRIQNVNKQVKATPWEKVTRPLSAPVRAWKKSVLLGSPRWYVNNEIFNQLQGISAGGAKFLLNQRKTGQYLEHIKQNAKARNAPSEAKRILEDVGSNISTQTGGGRLSKIATKQENRARVALYRTFRQRGMSHDDAAKKLNQSLFKYTTKNWERPIKTVVPFWAFQKNVMKAAGRMPFDHPKSAVAYNSVDQKQQQDFNKQFDTEVVPKLKAMGATDEDISKARAQQSKFYGGKIRLPNGNYMTMPFNAFSESGMDQFGLNPYLSMFSEVVNGTDAFGNSINGRESTFAQRLISKFPQAQLTKEGITKALIKSGKMKPTSNWIGKPGSEGYGMSKEAQGYDPTKANYQKNLDGGANFNKNLTSWLGAPRQSNFDTSEFIRREQLKRAKTDYFKLDTKGMKWDEAEAKRSAIFKKYGLTADEFYKGELGKYDTDSTKEIKGMKEDARTLNNKLREEYLKQPKGSRGAWAVAKLNELNKSGYFDKNPFLKSFDWLTNDTVIKADKTAAYRKAKASGDWTAYNATYGASRQLRSTPHVANGKHFKSKASMDRYLANANRPKFTHDGKHFKSAESMNRYKEGKFWDQFSKASKDQKDKLLADNPQFNTRKDWTAEQWQYWRDHKNDDFKQAARTKIAGFAAAEQKQKYLNRVLAAPVLAKKGSRSKYAKVAYGLRK